MKERLQLHVFELSTGSIKQTHLRYKKMLWVVAQLQFLLFNHRVVVRQT